MTALAAFRAKVAAGVAARIVPAVVDRAVLLHAKREWRECECDWCALKRRHHSAMQFAPYSRRDERRIAGRVALKAEMARVASGMETRGATDAKRHGPKGDIPVPKADAQ